MIYKKLSQLQKTLAIALTVVGAYGSLPLPSQATPIQAQSALLGDSKATPAQATKLSLQLAQDRGQLANRSATNPFKNPLLLKDRGAPGQREGGAGRGRGRCRVASKRLTALVPIIPATPDQSQHPIFTSTPAASVLGLTVTDHPTFWFYVPSSLTPAQPVEFILKDDKDNTIYQTKLSESGSTPGVVGFKLPNTVPALEVNKRYNWFLTISCQRQQESTSVEQDEPIKIFVSGWVERFALDASLQRQLESATPEQKALVYAKAGIWHEAVTTLAERRRQKPNDDTLKEEWANLLRSINLDAIAPEPITSMLTPKK